MKINGKKGAFIKLTFALISLFLILTASAFSEDEKIIRLEDLDLSNMAVGWGQPVAKKSIDKKPLTMNGVIYENGVGSHAASRFTIDLKGAAKYFKAVVGIDDETSGKKGSVVFKVYVDKKKVFESSILKVKSPVEKINVDLKNAKRLDLIITDGGDTMDYDHANWADAYIVLEKDSKEIPVSIPRPALPKVILTPKEKETPKINAPGRYGAGTNRDFMYYIPVTGKRPLDISVEGLPKGLLFVKDKGIIVGTTGDKAKYELKITAKNDLGKDEKKMELVIGEGLSLTPPMGWNSWNCWGCSVDEEKIKASADAMVSSGLINYGWSYINIDDCWQGDRDKNSGEITSNPKFPDMKALADYIHNKGLKFGVYTDAGTKTCAGYEGTKGHDEIDCKVYAKWTVDYVKIDWCHTEGMDPEEAYTIFGKAVQNCGRDIVFSMCNWGVKEPWLWAEKTGANLWRTTGDIVDTWGSTYDILCRQVPLFKYAKPGHWNDPDMLVVGKVGWGPKLRDSRLSPDEQYSHITLWSLLASPLLIGCDLSQIDDFTMNLLGNSEVIEINQDILGKQAERIVKDGNIEVWARDLNDGAKAVGVLCVNGDDIDETMLTDYSLKWDMLKISGEQKVRDLWRQKDMGTFKDSIIVSLPINGVQFMKISPVK